jgi:hypothetical protein
MNLTTQEVRMLYELLKNTYISYENPELIELVRKISRVSNNTEEIADDTTTRESS